MNKRNKEILEDKLGSGQSKFKKNKSKPQGKRKRSNSRDFKDLEFKEESSGVKQSCVRDGGENDPKWYSASEQLLNDAFSMSTPYALGSPLTFDDVPKTVPSTINTKTQYWASGILTLDVLPIPGISRDGYSPVNIAAGKLYQWVRHANAGSTMYDTADLMMYMLAMDNAYMLWGWLARAYGVMRTYNQTNMYMPKELIKAMGIDFNSVYSRLSDLRYMINQFGSEIGSYAVPAVMPYFTRHAWLFSNVYTDSPSFKAQLYVINPTMLYTWVDAPSTGERGYLAPQPIGNSANLLTYDNLLELIQMTTSGLGDSDFRVMSGDVLKAYGLNNLLTVPEITPDYTVLPVYSEEVLMQIQNVQGVMGILSTDNYANARITQNDNVEVICNPTFQTQPPCHCDRTMMNFSVDHPTPSDVAVASRLMVFEDPTTLNANGTYVNLFTAGSEVVTRIHVRTLQNGGNAKVTAYRTQEYANNVNLNLVAPLSHFHYHPLIRAYNTETVDSQTVYKMGGVIGDLENATVVDALSKKKMDDTALLSLFDVPEVAFN